MTPSQQLYAIIREVSDLLHELHQEKPFRRREVCVKLQEIGGQLCEVRAALEASDTSRQAGVAQRVFENRTRPGLTRANATTVDVSETHVPGRDEISRRNQSDSRLVESGASLAVG